MPNDVEIGEIVAHRAWRVHPTTARLHSLFIPFEWKPGVPMTGAPANPSQGVHAWKLPELNLAYINQFPGNFLIGGTVELYGMVEIHEQGYRAERAMIRSIDFAARREFRFPTKWQVYLLSDHYALAPLRDTYFGNR